MLKLTKQPELILLKMLNQFNEFIVNFPISNSFLTKRSPNN